MRETGQRSAPGVRGYLEQLERISMAQDQLPESPDASRMNGEGADMGNHGEKGDGPQNDNG